MSPDAPVVVLEGVRARDGAGEEGRPRGGLSGLSLALGPGVHAVLGAPEDGTLALAEVLAGRAAPLAGRVLVAGRDPRRSAATRAQIGVLAATPELPDGASVASWISVALRARGALAIGAAALLEPLGVAPLLARRAASLSFSEARAVELSLALGVPRPLLLCLVEPFADVAVPSPEPVRERLRALAAAGACVVLVTSSTVDASALADRIHVLDRGVIARTEPGAGERLAAAPGAAPPDAGRPEVEIHVLVHERAPDAPDAPGARALAAALASAPAVRAGAWEQGPAEASSTLRIRAADRDAAALAILDAAAREDVTLIAISSPPPSMHDVRAATALHLAAVRSRRPFGAPAIEGAAPLPGAPQGPFAVAAFDAPAPPAPAAPPSRPSDGPPTPAGEPLSAPGDAAFGGRIGADSPGTDGSPRATETGRHDGG